MDGLTAHAHALGVSPLDEITLGDVYRRHLSGPRGPYEDLANRLTIAAGLLRTSTKQTEALGRLEVATALLQDLQAAQDRFVHEARELGGSGRSERRAATWQQIGDALGIEKQSAWCRYGRPALQAVASAEG